MDTQLNQVNQEAQLFSLGERFRQARQSLDLTIEEVSAKINVRPVIIERLENNEFIHKSIPATFMKGYVRNYAKFLKLPEHLWNGVIDFGDAPKNDLSKTARVKKVTNPHSSASRWVGLLTALVLLVAVGMTALWWWESYQQSNSERDTLVQTYELSKPTENTAESTTEKAMPVELQPMSNATNTNTTNTEVTTVPVVTETQLENTAVSSFTSSAEVQTAVQNSAENTTENTAENTAEENPVVAMPVNGDLQIEITKASSWITVKDAKRKNLAQKEYKQGEVLTFDGKGPYALTIGAPANVKITYKGEVYPLKIDGRVARIKLQ